jgi:hypothetical protein
MCLNNRSQDTDVRHRGIRRRQVYVYYSCSCVVRRSSVPTDCATAHFLSMTFLACTSGFAVRNLLASLTLLQGTRSVFLSKILGTRCLGGDEISTPSIGR